MDRKRTPFGPAFLVGAGWYLLVAVAFLVAGLAETPGPGCEDSVCLGILDVMPFVVAILSVPLLLILLAVTALVVRWRLPVLGAGTVVAALTAVVMFVALVLVKVTT